MQSTAYSSAEPQKPPDEPPASTSANSEAFKTLLTGPGSGQMNLRAVRERAYALRKSLDEFIDILQFQPHRLSWDDSLDRFGVMGVRHQQLVEQLRPLLKFYVAHPKAVNQSNAEVLPLLLSTMRLPEIQAEERELLAGHDSAVAAMGLAPYFEHLGTTVENFNKLLDEVTRHNSRIPESGVLDPKGPRRQALSLEIRNAVNAASKPAAKVQRAAASSDEGEAAILLAAALRGEGL